MGAQVRLNGQDLLRDRVYRGQQVAAFNPLRLELERQSPPREQLHPKLLGRIQRLRQEAQRLLTISIRVTAQDHIRVLVARPGHPGSSPHLGAHRQCILEVPFGFAPSLRHRGQDSQLTRHGALVR